MSNLANWAEVHKDTLQDQWVQRAIDFLLDQAEKSISSRGLFRLAISGGSTPGPVFEQMVDWPKSIRLNTELFWVDERLVPKTSSNSNSGTALKILGDSFPQNFPIPSEWEALSSFNKAMQKKLPFDLIQLGFGLDGHTASLFEIPTAYSGDSCPYRQTGFHAGFERVSLSFQALQQSKARLILANGASKAKFLEKVQFSEGGTYPIQYLYPSKTEDTWMICAQVQS